MIQSRWSQNILIGVLFLIIALLVWWGWSNGVRSSQSKRIVRDAQAMVEGFKEFYKDQNRYPATIEFKDTNLMRPYITNFPAQEFVTANCQETFDYFNPNSQTYELRFCLPKAVGGFQAGWNTLKP